MSTRYELITPDFKAFERTFKARRKQFYADAMTLIVADIVKGIQGQVAITGGSFPALEPETIAKKGHSKALIDKGLLSDAATYQKLNKYLLDAGEITIKPRTSGRGKNKDTPRDRVGEDLQIRGIKSKKGLKKFFFFGISKDSADQITTVLDQIILESLEAM